MRVKTLVLTFAFLFSVAVDTSYAQGFPWELYKPRTVSEIIKLNADVESRKYDQRQVALNADSLPSQVRVTYTEQSRPISALRNELIKMWIEIFRVQPDIGPLLESELLFKECDNEYWIPVQKQVIPHFAKELKKGDMVSLFIVRVGGEKAKDKWDWLFIVNEFQK